jgi:hypothetical protein
MYPCVPLGSLSVISATTSERLVAELIEKVETGTWEGLTGWLNSLSESSGEVRRRAAAAAHELHVAGVAVQHVAGIDGSSVRDVDDVYG